MSTLSLATQNITKAKALLCKNSNVVSMLTKFSEDECKMHLMACHTAIILTSLTH
jgi:hypothetical protein